MPIPLSRNYDSNGSHEARTHLRFDFDEPMICSEYNKLNVVMQMYATWVRKQLSILARGAKRLRTCQLQRGVISST